jgi:hypothetical protein
LLKQANETQGCDTTIEVQCEGSENKYTGWTDLQIRSREVIRPFGFDRLAPRSTHTHGTGATHLATNHAIMDDTHRAARCLPLNGERGQTILTILSSARLPIVPGEQFAQEVLRAGAGELQGPCAFERTEEHMPLRVVRLLVRDRFGVGDVQAECETLHTLG